MIMKIHRLAFEHGVRVQVRYRACRTDAGSFNKRICQP